MQVQSNCIIMHTWMEEPKEIHGLEDVEGIDRDYISKEVEIEEVKRMNPLMELLEYCECSSPDELWKLIEDIHQYF